jgi:hypothetical protein
MAKMEQKYTSFCLLGFGVLCFCQAMLFQQRGDLIGPPKVVVNLPVLSLSHGCEFNCRKQRISITEPHVTESGFYLLFSLLNFVESIVLLRTFTASAQASLRSHSSL